ncbi:MAG: SAM hydrolase/SAM-dependent halogenase family protein [Methylohalobius sp. ZOD2]
MLVIFSDFGCQGPYLGQMIAALKREAPGVEVIDLLNNAPSTDPFASAYLLAALARWWPAGTVFLCVVDPGVGSERLPVALKAEDKWFVGPDNGLFHTVARRSATPPKWYRIVWRPDHLSSSFHGRDLFAPVAAWLARGEYEDVLVAWEEPDLSAWSADLAEVIYLDHFGNAVTGLTYRFDWKGRRLRWQGRGIPHARTFADVPEGQPLWYMNSMGLVEIAVNRGNASVQLGLDVGHPVSWE